MERLVQVSINVFELFYRNARKGNKEDRDIFDEVDEITTRNDEDNDSDDDKSRENECDPDRDTDKPADDADERERDIDPLLLCK